MSKRGTYGVIPTPETELYEFGPGMLVGVCPRCRQAVARFERYRMEKTESYTFVVHEGCDAVG